MSEARRGRRALTPDECIAAEVRAEMARQRVTQTELARNEFGTYPQFMQARCSGAVPFSAWELVKVANYLHVDVVQFLNAGKQGEPTGSTISPGNIDFHGSSPYRVSHLRSPSNTPLARAA